MLQMDHLSKAILRAQENRSRLVFFLDRDGFLSELESYPSLSLNALLSEQLLEFPKQTRVGVTSCKPGMCITGFIGRILFVNTARKGIPYASGKGSQRVGTAQSINAVCLMPNHVHLVMNPQARLRYPDFAS